MESNVTVTPTHKKKFITKSARLEKSLTLTKELVNNQQNQANAQHRYYTSKISIMKQELRNKKNYRSQKIACLKQSNAIQRKIAAALHKIARTQSVLGNPYQV